MDKSERHVESQIAAYPAGEVGQRACRTQRLDLIRLTSGFSVVSVAQLAVYMKEIFLFLSLLLRTPFSFPYLSRALFLSLSLSLPRIFSLCISNGWPILCSASLAPLSHRPDSSKGRISATYKTRRLSRPKSLVLPDLTARRQEQKAKGGRQ